MQVLNVPQTNPTPYSPVGSGNVSQMYGQPSPNPSPSAGGLPALSGLSASMNPLSGPLRTPSSLPQQPGGSAPQAPQAQQLQAQGRGEDSVLVHMTPNEVNSLRGLAQQFGGDLTVNPTTGLPEAGWLGKLLPTILGAIATPLTGGLINPLTASALIGAGTGIATGNLGKGLMAGLQAYGGAALGSAAGLNAGSFGIGQAANAANATGAVAGAAPTLSGAPTIASQAPTTLLPAAAPGALAPTASLAPLPASVTSAANAAATKAPGFFSRFGAAAKAGLPSGTPAIIAKNAPMLAGMGVLNAVSDAATPSGGGGEGGYPEASTVMQGYTPTRMVRERLTPEARKAYSVGNTGQRRWFGPARYEAAGEPRKVSAFEPTYAFGMAEGGEYLDDGAFIVDARTVSELGNGSSNAGMELLSKLGGKPIEGPGDGVSDSIRANIGGKQEARVARDEVKFDRADVTRLGGGSHDKGVKKLYSLMDKAHKARKKADRGEDTKLRKGLAALG